MESIFGSIYGMSTESKHDGRKTCFHPLSLPAIVLRLRGKRMLTRTLVNAISLNALHCGLSTLVACPEMRARFEDTYALASNCPSHPAGEMC